MYQKLKKKHIKKKTQITCNPIWVLKSHDCYRNGENGLKEGKFGDRRKWLGGHFAETQDRCNKNLNYNSEIEGVGLKWHLRNRTDDF